MEQVYIATDPYFPFDKFEYISNHIGNYVSEVLSVVSKYFQVFEKVQLN